MLKKKNYIQIEKFKLSNNAIEFIRKYIINELNISSPIDEEILDEIIELAESWEVDMIDPLSKNGADKDYDYSEKERNESADKFISEITGQWEDDNLVPDIDDLNQRLGLK